MEEKSLFRRTFLVLMLGFLGFVGIDVYHTFVDGYRLTVASYPTCITELYILDGVRDVVEKRDLYPTFGRPPFIWRAYNFLTYLPAGYLGRWLSKDLDSLLLYGRIVSYISMLMLLLLVIVLFIERFGSWLLALLAVALLCTFHSSTLTDFFRNRPEMPGITLSVAGWYVCQRRGRGWIYWGGLCFVLAIALKQSFLSAPAAIFIHCLVRKEYRYSLYLTGICLAGGVLTCSFAYLFLGAGYFHHTVFAMASQPIRILNQATFFYSILLEYHWGLFLPAALFAAGWLFWCTRTNKDREPIGLLIYLLVCFVWTSFSCGKEGADINYFGELSVLLVIVTVFAISEMYQRLSRGLYLVFGLLCLQLLSSTLQHGYGRNRVCYNRDLPQPRCDFQKPPFGDVKKYVERYVQDREHTLILQEEIAVRVGRPQILDRLAFHFFFQSGLVQFEDLAMPVKQQLYRRIVFPAQLPGFWTSQIYSIAIRSGYRVTFRDREIMELTRSTPPPKGASLLR